MNELLEQLRQRYFATKALIAWLEQSLENTQRQLEELGQEIRLKERALKEGLNHGKDQDSGCIGHIT